MVVAGRVVDIRLSILLLVMDAHGMFLVKIMWVLGEQDTLSVRQHLKQEQVWQFLDILNSYVR